MAVVYTFKCKKCNKEIRGVEGNIFALFSGMSVQFRCSSCHALHLIPLKNKWPSITDGGIEKLIKDTEEFGQCKECGKISLKTWAFDIDGCPKCGGELEKLDETVMFLD